MWMRLWPLDIGQSEYSSSRARVGNIVICKICIFITLIVENPSRPISIVKCLLPTMAKNYDGSYSFGFLCVCT